MKNFFLFLTACFVSLNVFATSPQIDEDEPINEAYDEMEYSFEEPFIRLNPYGRNELAALIKFPTEQKAQISLSISGRENAQPIETTFEGFHQEHTIPVLGLYPDFKNAVTLKALFEDGSKKEKTFFIQTPKIKKRGLIVIEGKKDTQTNYYYLHDGVVFDEEGWIRFSFDNANETVYLLNNELIAEDRNTGLTRYSLLGKKEQHYPLPKGFTSFAHGMAQKPNGNFLLIGSFSGKKAMFEGQEQMTQREFVIELDYKNGEMVNSIDFAELLNPDRSVIVKSAAQNYGMNDWCHINSVDYDTQDNSIVISCRHAGLAKADEKTKTLKWLFSPNKDLLKSGRNGQGPALTNKLLTAVDQNGKPFDTALQTGQKAIKEFKFPVKTHHFAVAGNQMFSVYDNSGTLFDKSIVSTPHSNAAVYHIDTDKKTVSMVWFEPLPYSADSASSTHYLPHKNAVVVYSSTVPDKNQTGISIGKLVRFNLNTHEKLFEATVYRGGETYFYRADPFIFYKK